MMHVFLDGYCPHSEQGWEPEEGQAGKTELAGGKGEKH